MVEGKWPCRSRQRPTQAGNRVIKQRAVLHNVIATALYVAELAFIGNARRRAPRAAGRLCRPRSARSSASGPARPAGLSRPHSAACTDTFGSVNLRTPSLTLRVPAPEDIDAILAIHADPRACAHNPSDAITSHAEAEELFRRWLEQWQRHGAGYWTIWATDDGELLGFCGLKFVKLHSRRVLNLFCRLAPQHWGRGIGSEAASAAVQWARSHWPEVPIIARVRPANHASRKLAERCGLQRAADLDTDGEDGIDWLFVSGW